MKIRVAVLTFTSLVLSALALQVGNGQEVQFVAAKKDAKKEKKFEIPKDAVQGTVKAVDRTKATFTITLKDKKVRTFGVDKATEFWGPKGGDRGTGTAGLKDDCMAAGYEIKVAPAKDGKTAKDVYLPQRKAEPKKDKK